MIRHMTSTFATAVALAIVGITAPPSAAVAEPGIAA